MVQDRWCCHHGQWRLLLYRRPAKRTYQIQGISKKTLLCSIIDGFQGFQVPPAELESVLLTHPDIADAAVIGVYSFSEATELPRAYVVHAQPNSIGSEAQKAAFASSIQRWIQSKVARQKFLRGGTACMLFIWLEHWHLRLAGVVVITAIPKRLVHNSRLPHTLILNLDSAAGKILRRELREQAKKELNPATLSKL